MERIVEKALRPLTVVWRALALTLVLCATGSAWAGKLGEGITAYYDCETHTDSGTTVTVTGKSWDGSALTAPGTLSLQWNCNNGAGIGTPSTIKFGLCYSGGGTGGRCYQSSTCDGLLPGTSAGDWSFSFWMCGNLTSQFENKPSSGDNQGFRITKNGSNNIVLNISETTDGSTFNTVSITSSSTYTFDSSHWHNIIVVRSGNTLTLYVDGVSAGTASMTTGSYLVNNSNTLTMADASSGGIGQGNGSDEYCVWNRALSQGEVAAIAGGSAPISALANQTIESYTFSNADGNSLATNSDGMYGTTSFSFTLNNAAASLAAGDFPSSGYVQLTSISIAYRSDDTSAYKNITTATLTNNKTSESYTATVTFNESATSFTASLNETLCTDAGQRNWSRREVLLTFGTDGVLVDTTATYTLRFYTEAGDNSTLGYSVVKSGSVGWTPVMRIYGRTPSGSMEMPSSLIPSSGGMTLPSTVTVADAMGMAFANDSVTIGNSGIQIPLSSALNTQTVMVKAVIPSSSSRLIGWKVSDAIEAYTSYTGSQFEQHFLNNGSVYGTTYGTSAWTRDAEEHWVTVAYDRGSDTSTYLDGAKKITATNLKWGTLQTSKVTIGGTAYNTTDAATGMVIKDVQIYNQSLGSERVAKVVAALNAGWTVNAAGTTLTSAQAGSPLPGYENVQVYGTVTVAANGTLDLSGISQVLVGDGATLDVSGVSGLTYAAVTSGGVLTIGKQRPSVVVVTAGGTLAVAYDVTMSDRITGYTPTATLTVSGAIAGTVTLNGETVTPVVDGSTATLTGTAVAGDPAYTGNGWWWDYEFNGNGNNIGAEGTQLSWDGDRPLQGSEYTTADETGNQMLHLPARPWRDVTSYPSEFTAVMFCKAGATANGVLVAFGSTTYGSYKTITLSTGANPSAGQMRLVYGNYTDSSTDLVEGGFTLDNITSANHLYAFTVKTVGGVSQIAVYADGDLLTTYTADSLISLGPGFQIASGHGGLPSGLSRLANDDAATMDFLRVSNVALSDAAIKALAAEYRYVSPNGIAERTLSANATWTDETNTSWSQKTLNEDGSTTTTAQAAPNSGTVVEITASTDVQLTMDLASDVSYEKLTFQGDGAITVKAGGTAPTVTTRTYINTDVTMDIAAFASLGATTIADGKTLTVVPDETSTLNAGIALGFRGETSTIVTGTVTLGTGSQVVLPASMVSDFKSYGFTLTLTPDASGRYVYTIARDDNPVYVTKAANGTITYAMYPDTVAGTSAAMTLTLPAAPATIPDDFAYTVTFVNNHASESLTVDTAIAGGSIAVSSGTVELSGDSSVVNVSGSGTLEVTGSLAVSGTFANTLTLAGDGTVTFASLPASALTFGTWTGTVTLPHLDRIAGDTFSFNSYGIEGSTVRVPGIDGGWLKNEEVNPTVDIPEGVTLTISAFSASFNNTFKALSGAGTFAVTYDTPIDTTSGEWYSNYSAYFLVKNVSKFTGSLSTATPGIAIGSAKPAYATAGGKIYLASDVTLTVPSTSSIAPALAGEGRIVFDGALPTSTTLLTSLQDSSNWTGTVEIKNYIQPSNVNVGIIKFNDYGTSSSAIALNGVTSTIFAGNDAYPNVTLRELEIGEGGWTDGSTGNFTISPTYTANLTGHGRITITTGYGGTVKFIGDHTFDGSVAFNSGTGKQVAFMKTAGDTIPSVTAKAIVVAGGLDMSIASGKTWTAPGGIKIDGSLTVLTSEKASATSGTISAYQDDDKIDETEGEGTTTYESNPLAATLDNSSVEISDNQSSMGTVTVVGASSITGSGGAFMKALAISDGATLTYDPVITPLRVKSAPVFNGTGKLKLAARYAGVTCGKFHLVSYPSSVSVSGTLEDLVDSTSFSGVSYTVTEETVGSYKQLVLKVGDYDTNAKAVSIAQFGDSITEGIWRDGYRGTPNYRIPLMQLLEAYGYRPEARGYRSVGSTDANGIPADDNYKWHTGISAQRIYTGLTDGYFRAGFMESIEAHLEQVGVTDIITLKIGTNDSLGGETPDNMFEGWTNLVWKIVRMRPTSKIVVCAPVKIMKSGKETSESNAASLRTKIADYVDLTYEQGGFPNGQVTMINGFNIVTGDANYYLTDAIHPNWNGHLQLANGWLPAVTNAIESMTARATTGYTAQTVASAADAAELEAYRAGYVKLATFTNFNTKVSAWGENPYVSVNDTYKDMPMRRVAYFVARKTTTSPDTRYVWVDMDADETSGTTLAAFGMPTNAAVNGVVNNLHIYSNSSAIENVAPTVSGVKGTLMRTEKGVSGAAGISGANAPEGVTWDSSKAVFDWNDSIYAAGAWGVMNMARIFDGATPTNHRKLLAAQMLFDFNGFNGTRQNALGIGNFAVHGPYGYANSSVENFNLNWTFTTDKDEMPTMDARALETGVIEIWGKPAWGTIFSVY